MSLAQNQSVGSSGMDMDYDGDDDEDEEEIIEEEIIDDSASYEEEEVIMEDDGDDSVTKELVDDEGIDEILEESQEIMSGGDPSSRSYRSRSSRKSGGEGSQQRSKVGTVITGSQPAEQQHPMDGAQGQQDAPADEVPTSVVHKDVLLGDMSEMTHGSAKQPPVQHEEMLVEELSPREINGDGMNDKAIGEGSNRSSTSAPGNASSSSSSSCSSSTTTTTTTTSSSSSSIVESQKDRDPSERSVKEPEAIFSAASVSRSTNGSPPGSPGGSLASSHAHSVTHSGAYHPYAAENYSVRSGSSNEPFPPHLPRDPSGTAEMLNAASIVATAAAASDPKGGSPVDASVAQINQPEDESQQPKSNGDEREEDAKDEKKGRSENEENDATPMAVYVGALVLVVVALVFIIGHLFGLTKDNDDNDREVPIPTPIPPTDAPQPMPTPTEMGVWVEAIPSFAETVGSGFGTAVSMSRDLMAVGAPKLSGVGSVITAVYSVPDDKWPLRSPLLGTSPNSQFGYTLDMVDGQMIVGAPFAPLEDSIAVGGAAYFYSYAVDKWVTHGTPLRGGSEVINANEEFGAAVAISGADNSPQVVIGAPKSNKDTKTFETGRVYTFEGVNGHGNSTWSTLESTSLFGKNAYDWFGSSVDMSRDASYFIVGAPSNGETSSSAGYFQVYEWQTNSWVSTFEEAGSPGERFGSSVTILTEQGDIFAVGGPGFQGDAGRVVVYRKSSSRRDVLSSGLRGLAGGYEQYGAPIVGKPGFRFGSQGSITGGIDSDGSLLLIVSTASGTVETFGYDVSSDSWSPRAESIDVDEVSAPVDFSPENGLLVGLPGKDSIMLYRKVAATGSPAVANTVPPSSQPVDASTAPPPAAPTTLSPVGQATTLPTTDAPSSANVPAPVNGWLLSGSSFQPNKENSGFGSSVSLSSTRMAVGAPQLLSNGAVFVYPKLNGVWQTNTEIQLFGNEAGSGFGSSVFVSGQFVVAGAPQTVVPNTTTPAGAAFCYAEENGNFVQLGSTLRGDPSVAGSNENFGFAVSASTTGRVVVGAPDSSPENMIGRGRAYVYEYVSSRANFFLQQEIPGLAAGDARGYSVDISQDGTHIAVGAPKGNSGNGYFEVFAYDGTTWTSVFLQQGETGEAMGTSVRVISSTADIVAVGAPGYFRGQGRVVVYQKNSSGLYVAVGEPLVGESGERFGDRNLLGGEALTPSVIVGTALGQVKRFDYEASTGTWIQINGTVDTGFGTSMVGLASASQNGEFVVGGNNDATIYTSTSQM